MKQKQIKYAERHNRNIRNRENIQKDQKHRIQEEEISETEKICRKTYQKHRIQEEDIIETQNIRKNIPETEIMQGKTYQKQIIYKDRPIGKTERQMRTC